MKKNMKLIYKISIFYLLLISIIQIACTNEWNEFGYRIINNDNSLSADKSSIKGTVVRKANKTGIENLKVLLCKYIYASSDLFSGNNISCVGRIAETVTDKEGSYSFLNINPGTYSYAIEKPDSGGKKYLFLVKGSQTNIFQDANGYAIEVDVKANQTIEIKPVEF